MSSIFSKKPSFLQITLFCVGAIVSGSSFAQAMPDGQWHGVISVGGAAASSNTSTQTFNALANGSRETTADKISIYSLANYGNNKTNGVSVRTSQLLRLGGRYDYNLSNTLYAFGGGDFETNKIQNISSRYGLNAGLGYKVVRSADMSFDVFGGVGYSDTKFVTTTPPDASSIRGVQLLLGEESSHQLSKTSTVKQRFVYYPGQSVIGNRSTFDVSLATLISDAWTLNVGAGLTYNSKPSTGFKTTSSLVTFGFGYKY